MQLIKSIFGISCFPLWLFVGEQDILRFGGKMSVNVLIVCPVFGLAGVKFIVPWKFASVRYGRRRLNTAHYFATMAGTAAFAFLFVLFVGQAFTIEGPSMLPTLHGGERVFVDKLTYRFRPPQRGDVIVFRYPPASKQFFIKRVIGLPGDEVAIRNGRVFINGRPLDEAYTRGTVLGRYEARKVPEGHYFVLGDNRNNSRDSRNGAMGAIHRSLVTGKAFLRYWPLNRMSFSI